jgi:protein-S-isoprenylcysteine O-methyltransferase Ste14
MTMKVLLRVAAFESVLTGLFVTSAGRWDVPWFWVLIGVHAVFLLWIQSGLDSDLLRERWKPGPGARDYSIRFVAMPFLLGHMIVAGLDVGRFGWSGPIPNSWRVGALVAYVLGLALAGWAMRTNRFFSSVVRIQRDRGHRVVSHGPYRVLRHPGYAGVMVASVSGGVVMGSWWSIVPLVPLIALFAWRTSMEDRVLRTELEGYADYASRVRYRLLPGLW